MVGGILRLVLEKVYEGKANKDKVINNGVLCCSGMIAGEGLVGILLAILAVATVNGKTIAEIVDLSGVVNLGQIGGLIVMALIILLILKFTIWSKEAKETK